MFKQLSFLSGFSFDKDEYSGGPFLSYKSDILKEYGVQFEAYTYFKFLKSTGLINSIECLCFPDNITIDLECLHKLIIKHRSKSGFEGIVKIETSIAQNFISSDFVLGISRYFIHRIRSSGANTTNMNKISAILIEWGNMPMLHKDEYKLKEETIGNYASELYDLMKSENYLLCFGAIYRISKYSFFKYFCAEVTDLHNNVSILVLRVSNID